MPNQKHWPQKASFLFSILLSLFLLSCFSFFSKPCHPIPVDIDSMESTKYFIEESYRYDMMIPKDELISLAESGFLNGQWKESAIYAKRVLSIKPDNPKAHGILGTIYALTGQKEMAQKELLFFKTGHQDIFYELITSILEAQETRFKKAEEYLHSALQKQPEHPVANYYLGSLHLIQKKLPKAEESFRSVIASNPGFSPALAGLGETYLQQKKMKEAAEYYQKAIMIEPENLIYRGQLLTIFKETGQKEEANRELKLMLYYTPGVKEDLLRKGMHLVIEGYYEEAIVLMDKAIGAYKKLPEANYIKAMAYINLKDSESALQNIRSFLNEKSNVPQERYYAGMCYLALDHIDKAEEQFKIALSLNLKMPRFFLPLIIIEQIKGDYDAALRRLRQDLSKVESSSFIHFLSAHILLAKGDKKGYLEEIKGATELMPGLDKDANFIIPKENDFKNFSLKRNLITLYFSNGWYGKAIQLGNELLGIHKNDRFAWYYKAMSEVAQKKSEQAIQSFKQLTRNDPDLLAAHMGLGKLYMETNDFEKSMKAIKRVIEIDPKYGSAYLALGDIYLQKEDEEQAIHYYLKAIEVKSNLFKAYQRLALIFSESPKDLNKALEFAEEAEALGPDDPFSLDVLGWVFVQKGEIDKGILKLREASERLPQDPLIQYHLGIAHYKNNDFKEAKRALQAAVNKSKDFRGIEHAQKILKKITD